MPYEGPGVYRHHKGQRYVVLGAASHSETREEFVVYRRLNDPGAQMFIRPAKLFDESVCAGSGISVPRFVMISRHIRKGNGND